MMREVKTFNDTEYWGFSKSGGFLNNNGEGDDVIKLETLPVTQIPTSSPSADEMDIIRDEPLGKDGKPISSSWLDTFTKAWTENIRTDYGKDKEDEDLSWREKRRKKREENNGKDDEGGISTLGWVGIGVGGLAVVGLTIYLLTRKK
jgi:hypothetical protein